MHMCNVRRRETSVDVFSFLTKLLSKRILAVLFRRTLLHIKTKICQLSRLIFVTCVAWIRFALRFFSTMYSTEDSLVAGTSNALKFASRKLTMNSRNVHIELEQQETVRSSKKHETVRSKKQLRTLFRKLNSPPCWKPSVRGDYTVVL